MLVHVPTLAGQRPAGTVGFSGALFSAVSENRGKNGRVTFGATEGAASGLMLRAENFFSKNVETTLVRRQTEHDEIGIQTVDDVTGE